MSLEERIKKLETAVFGKGTTKEAELRPFGFEKLELTWAKRKVFKDPKFWKGDSQAGKTFDQCPEAFLRMLAQDRFKWAQKQKEMPNPKVDKNGKPYWEQDEFEARLALTWAEWMASGNKSEVDDGPLPGDEEIPF